MTRTTPRRLITLQRSQRRFTDADTFTFRSYSDQRAGVPTHSRGRVALPGGSYVRNRYVIRPRVRS
jgi:hypothetical protein